MGDVHTEQQDDHRFTRRQVLQGGTAAALGVVALTSRGAAAAATTDPGSLSGSAPLVAAMHVHASYSEQEGSWEQQYAAAVSAGADVMWQTDHDFRARAQGYMGLLRGTWTPATTGSWAQHAASFSAQGPIRVMVEAAGSTAATQSLAMDGGSTAQNGFRTGVDGQSIAHTFGASRLDPGAIYEVVLGLSRHPATTARPAGTYSLRYRFAQGATPSRTTEGGGLVGVVLGPLPANGTTVTFTPADDIAAIWPDMLAIDNVSLGLSFVVSSPRHGVVADVQLASVRVNRVRHDAAGVLAAQQLMAQQYSARYGVAGIVSEELSMAAPAVAHCNVFGAPPEFNLRSGVTTANWQSYCRDYITRQHNRGGLVSWNHPFGAEGTPALRAADQVPRRRQVLAQLLANDLLGADILEVGYAVRGHMPMEQHLELWDTLSRRARWLTGNGVSDDHHGLPWQGLINGHLTGVWAGSSSEADMTAALRSGRVFTYHCARTPGLQFDTLVDGQVPMGQASVTGLTSRSVAVQVANLPSDCTVELLVGPVDYAGQDPGTSLVRSWAASSFPAGTGTVSVAVNTTAECFIRPQIRQRGTLVASGNPTWLLHRPPPGGVPAARQA